MKKLVKNNQYWRILFLLGLVTVVFGMIFYKVVTEEGRNISMLKGMILGIGFTFIVISVVKMIQNKLTPEEKLKMKEIEGKDERHVEILRISFSVASAVATGLFAILTFVFVAADYIIPAFMALGAMYIQMIAFLTAYVIFSKKM